jgi:hypothetical protein
LFNQAIKIHPVTKLRVNNYFDGAIILRKQLERDACGLLLFLALERYGHLGLPCVREIRGYGGVFCCSVEKYVSLYIPFANLSFFYQQYLRNRLLTRDDSC